MVKKIRDDIIAAGIDKRVKGLLEPKIGKHAYEITRSLLTGYIKTLLEWAQRNEYKTK